MVSVNAKVTGSEKPQLSVMEYVTVNSRITYSIKKILKE
jgi:hypothetical protein